MVGGRGDGEGTGVRLGILGGTFDPIHYAHLVVAEECRYRLDLDHVLLVPSAQPPHKQGRRVAPAADRLRMVELAVANNPRLRVSRLEVDREGPSYSVDTVRALRQEHGPEAELFFIIGVDALSEMITWREPRALLRLCKLAVVSRPTYNLDLTPLLPRLPELAERVVRVPVPALDISSTDLRRRVARGEPIKYQLPEAVELYIREHGLYANEP
jgi:nicotinate-nucleotide adenylyltransferase